MGDVLGIILLEDSVNDGEMIRKELKTTIEQLKKWKIMHEMGFSDAKIEWVCGSDKENKREKRYRHFIKDDLIKLDNKIKEMESKFSHVGILMDVILTREEQDRADINDFSSVAFSKQIMDTYEQEYNIYIVTGIRNFGSRAWGIYGRENMVERYILKGLINEYPSRKAMAGALYWLYHKEKLPERIADMIEDKELEFE